MEDSAFPSGITRSRLEVKVDLLQAIREGAGRPTPAMYRSNVSWSVIQGFIKTLEVQGLVRTELSERKKRYLLADKGESVLKTYLSLHKQIDSLAPVPLIGQTPK